MFLEPEVFAPSTARLSLPLATATSLDPSEEAANDVQFALVAQAIQDAPESCETRIGPNTEPVASVIPFAEEATPKPEV